MAKITSLEELKKLKQTLQSKVDIREKGEDIDKQIQVKVAMATCGIAAGGKKVMDTIIAESKVQGLNNVVVTQTGCMGLCYCEPTIEITVPGKEPVVYGNVTEEKAKELVLKYMKNGELVDGIIPVNYKTV